MYGFDRLCRHFCAPQHLLTMPVRLCFSLNHLFRLFCFLIYLATVFGDEACQCRCCFFDTNSLGKVEKLKGKVAMSDKFLTDFLLGMNYGYNDYGTDFGGSTEWSKLSVSENPNPIDVGYANISAHGISIVRHWIFAELWTDRISYSGANGTSVTGIDSILVQDIEKILKLASDNNLKLELTWFSFDAFTAEQDGPPSRKNLSAIVRNPIARAALINNLVVPMATAAANSPHSGALAAWDLCNEPEWAITSDNPTDSNAEFDPDGRDGFDPISYSEMVTFFSEMIVALRSINSSIPITIGQASAKWAKAFTSLDLDFYEHHYYEWMEPYYPITDPIPPSFNGKPVVLGEFPIKGAPAASVTSMINSWRASGHKAVYGWDYKPTYSTVSQRDLGLDEMLSWRTANPIGGSPPPPPPRPKWVSAPATVTQIVGHTIVRTGIRANHVDEQGQTVTVSEGSQEPQLTAFNYDRATDTITATVGTMSGTVPLRLYNTNGQIVDTVDWPINVIHRIARS